MHIVDWFPTLLSLVGHQESIPTDRVLYGVDQSALIRGEQEDSNREHFPMFFGQNYVGMRYRNFKILTHRVEDGSQPIQKLAMPHVQNLTVDPDEEMTYYYEKIHTWVLYQVYGPKSVEYQKSLAGDAVPKRAPLDSAKMSIGIPIASRHLECEHSQRPVVDQLSAICTRPHPIGCGSVVDSELHRRVGLRRCSR